MHADAREREVDGHALVLAPVREQDTGAKIARKSLMCTPLVHLVTLSPCDFAGELAPLGVGQGGRGSPSGVKFQAR
jgi:hypothetical protein